MSFEDRRATRWSPKRQAIGWIWLNGNNLDSRGGHRETHGPDPSDDIPDLSGIKWTLWVAEPETGTRVLPRLLPQPAPRSCVSFALRNQGRARRNLALILTRLYEPGVGALAIISTEMSSCRSRDFIERRVPDTLPPPNIVGIHSSYSQLHPITMRTLHICASCSILVAPCLGSQVG